jgi:NADPH-dependent curcumin reductase CurA
VRPPCLRIRAAPRRGAGSVPAEERPPQRLSPVALAAGEVVAAIGALGMVAMTAFIALRLLTRRKQ